MRTSGSLIGIDFDGTIADTSAFKQEWTKERFGIYLPRSRCNRSGMLAAGLSNSDYDDMLLVACDKEHTLAAKACPGAILGIRQLSEVAELCLVTDRGEFRDWLKWCELWLEWKGIRDLLRQVFSTQWQFGCGRQTTKQQICRENLIVVLVDDDAKNLEALGETRPILYLRDDDDTVPTIPGIQKAPGWPEVVSLCQRFLD